MTRPALAGKVQYAMHKNAREKVRLKYVICIGEMLIDFIPNAQEHPVEGNNTCYHPHPGGAPANVAVAVSRLKGPSRFIGKLSEDGFGQLLLKTLHDNQVDTRYVQTTKQGLTTLALVALKADGQRQFTFYRHASADTLLEVGDLDWTAWQDAAVCHAGSISLSVEPARSATLAAIDYTQRTGSIVSFDANIRPAFWTSDIAIRETLAQVVARTDLLKFSAEEAHFLGESEQASLEDLDRSWLHKLGKRLLEQGPRLVIITLGSQGAILMTAKHEVEVPAFPVRPIDTTGAGDAFMGAVLFTLMQQGCNSPVALSELSESDLNHLGGFANKAAGLSTTRYGGIISLPYMEEVEGLH